MLRYLLLAVAVVLTSCATTAGYEKSLNSWVGAEEADLVRAWGPPDQTYEAGGRKFIAYASQRNVYLPGTPPAYQTTVLGNTVYTNPVAGTAPVDVVMSCMTTFELQGSKILSWSYKGNACKGKE